MNNEKQPLLGYQFRGLMIVGGTDLFMFTWLDLKWCYHITICFIFVRVSDFRSDSLDTMDWYLNMSQSSGIWMHPRQFRLGEFKKEVISPAVSSSLLLRSGFFYPQHEAIFLSTHSPIPLLMTFSALRQSVFNANRINSMGMHLFYLPSR